MKCEDFHATGVVTYVERENSEAIRNFIILHNPRDATRG